MLAVSDCTDESSRGRASELNARDARVGLVGRGDVRSRTRLRHDKDRVGLGKDLMEAALACKAAPTDIRPALPCSGVSMGVGVGVDVGEDGIGLD